MTDLLVRSATVFDVPAIEGLVAPLAQQKILIAKETVAYYEGIQEFVVVEVREADGSARVVACGALHVMWRDIAEVRTLATSASYRGKGLGRMLVAVLLERARDLGVKQVFCLTFEVAFFERMGFRVMPEQSQLDPEIFAELLRSPDEGVAEFLDLARVKPNTLGNTRMIIDL
ncbi:MULTISPECIES: amino-acid N-acetyltransferase [unclassified Rothia (in: high G+C Gram-positive bacteria)]|uniref:amino-acid N-acetyltransferase n=1 Tax=unclassified Rothia (in: high G+C Gram-positive bacteria) TaxID=2689056 RepID=UPI00195E68C7|nr:MULTISPECIES: amino-acid N-acetyltransferase [unclassified Rothia (in: high G+C Gram-positive bacteria)]MBM7051599.1 amino-acid N-acetyltransferase [Rothia sp. ZJ1223]QRZ61764.1 amino-acid N-acetyltransferase [Rothia sp. ZJ932]